MGSDVRPSPFAFAPGPYTKPFWDACARGALTAARCGDCKRLFLPPGPICPHCWSNRIGTQRLSGRGEIATFTTYRQSYHPSFHVPYVIALIMLREGPRLISNIIACAPEEVRIGMPVEVRFERRGDITLPVFAPADAATTRETGTFS